MSDKGNDTMDGEIRGFSDLLEEAGQGARAVGTVDVYEDNMAAILEMSEVAWTKEPPPFDPDLVYRIPTVDLDLDAPIMVDADNINVDDLVNAKPGGIIRCKSLPVPIMRLAVRHPLEADWAKIWDNATGN